MNITHSRYFDIATTRNTDEAVATRYKKTLADVAVPIAVAIAIPAALAPAVYAQDGEEKERRLEEVVVTGSRIVQDGFQSPTPTTIMSIEEMQASAPQNVADFINQLPSVTGSTRPQNSQALISSGEAGINTMNLRGIGNDRTLTLLDGQRSVPSVLGGAVDVNNFPQSLISRVDVVTGGGSAAYGSDAIAGVVNYVLNKDFTGIKASLDTSSTLDYGDNDSLRAAVAGGSRFASERGHFMFEVEVARKDGIMHSDRDWNRDGWSQMINPNYRPGNGEPFRLILPNMGLSNATPGGIITSGPLRGMAFGEGGIPYNFNYGNLVNDPYMQGGDWRSVDRRHLPSLDPKRRRHSLFGRLSFDVTDNLRIYAQLQSGNSKTENICCSAFALGNLTVSSENAFIPDPVRSQLKSKGITSFRMGTTYGDLPPPGSRNDRTTDRLVLGADGRITAFASTWNWDIYYQKGETRSKLKGTDMWDRQRLSWALDSIVDPNSGTAVCRATFAGVAGAEGCVPFNLFGTNVNSRAAIEYLGIDGSGQGGRRRAGAYLNEELTQEVVSVSLSGEPFSWRGNPVAVAFGGEHRSEEVTGNSDIISQTTRWFAGNYLATTGKYEVTEGFLEALVPLVQGKPWAESLDLNTVVRFTDYSTSGSVSTWKAGATYIPVEDVTVRLTRSRDIRAPSLQDLFQAGTANTNNVRDPFNNNVTTQFLAVRTGNLNLLPEKADTTGVGIVYEPSFAPGLSASVDYYEIELEDALGQPSAQTIVDRCFTGNQTFCAAISRDPAGNLITRINIAPFNIARQRHRGIDYEIFYQLPLETLNDSWFGELTFRALATHYLWKFEDNGIDTPTQTAGQSIGSGPPDWLYRASLSAATERYRATLIARGVSSGTFNNAYIECTKNCPASTPENNTINDNRVDGAFYLDANFTYNIQTVARDGRDLEVYIGLENLTNQKPPIRASGPGGVVFSTAPTDLGLFDGVGRSLRLGIRLSM